MWATRSRLAFRHSRVHRLPRCHRLRELASGREKRNEAALPDRSHSQLNSPRLLSRGPQGREGLQALRTVRPDKFPTAIFHGGCPPELESRLDG